MTTEQIQAAIPALLDALRTAPLTPELDEVRSHLQLSAEPCAAPGDAESELTFGELGLQFHPVTINGEPLSETIIRARGE